MILDIFMLWIIIGVILLILGIELENIVYNMLSVIIFIIIFIQSLWIEVPGIADYADYTSSAMSLAFIFTNIVWLLILNARMKKRKRFHL